MRKNYLLLTLLLFSTIRCSDPEVLNYNLLKQKNGIHYRQKFFGEEVYSGNVITTNSSGRMVSEGYIKNGKFHGSYKIYDDDGQLKELKTYNNGKLDGKVKSYYSGQLISEGILKDSVRNGKWTSWYYNGEKEKEENYKNGKLNGSKRTYYKNGALRTEGIYPDGTFKTYYSEHGQLYCEGSLKNNESDGVYKCYTQYTGKLEEEITYKDGLRHGPLKRYDYKGRLTSLQTWKNDGVQGLVESYRYPWDGVPKDRRYIYTTHNRYGKKYKYSLSTEKEYRDVILKDSLGTLFSYPEIH